MLRTSYWRALREEDVCCTRDQEIKREVDINGAKPHHGNNTSCNGNYQAGSSTGIIEIAVDEGQDDHEVEDFVLHVVGFQKLLCPPMHGTAGCLRDRVMQGATLQTSFKPATSSRWLELRKGATLMYL